MAQGAAIKRVGMLFSGGPAPAANAVICAAALSFNYTAARRAVFHSRELHRRVLPKFLAVAAGHALVSYAAIHWLTQTHGLALFPAKIAVETALFPLNFLLQRDWVFTSSRKPPR